LPSTPRMRSPTEICPLLSAAPPLTSLVTWGAPHLQTSNKGIREKICMGREKQTEFQRGCTPGHVRPLIQSRRQPRKACHGLEWAWRWEARPCRHGCWKSKGNSARSSALLHNKQNQHASPGSVGVGFGLLTERSPALQSRSKTHAKLLDEEFLASSEAYVSHRRGA